MTDHETESSRAPTDPAPPLSDDTPPGGRAAVHPPRVVLGPEAQSDLLVRLVLGVEEMGREVRAMRGDLRLVLEEGRAHAARLSAIEARVAALRCQQSGECPGG